MNMGLSRLFRCSISGLKNKRFYHGPRKPTASSLIIGNEILTGKVVDTNSNYLSRYFYNLGIDLKCIYTVQDNEDDIVEAVNLLRKYDYVITSGGVGPTHDDITYASIAKAFSVGLTLNYETLNKMEKYMKVSDINEARKRMALFPSNSRTYYPCKDKWVPIVIVGNVFILPGVPKLFEEMLKESTSLFQQGEPIHHLDLRTKFLEGDFSELLRSVQEDHPNVKIGSYPNFINNSWETTLSIEGTNLAEVEFVYKKVKSIL